MEKQKRDKYNIADDNSVALDSELTGLVQTPPKDEDEARFYMEIASIPSPIPKKKSDRNLDKRQKH